MAYKPIESYGVIGDLHTVALVSMEGSICKLLEDKWLVLHKGSLLGCALKDDYMPRMCMCEMVRTIIRDQALVRPVAEMVGRI